ncbi:MAG: hypothetical protein WCQ45_00820 [bacterium]
MNLAAILLAALATGCLTTAFAVGGAGIAAFAPTLLGAVWVAVLLWRPWTPVHGLFLFMALGAAGLAAAQGHGSLALAATTASLFAWDAASVRRILAVLPPPAYRRIAPHYVAHAVTTAGVAFAVPLLAIAVRPALGFPTALGLSLGILALLGLALWQSGRVASFSHPQDADPGKSATKRDAGDR